MISHFVDHSPASMSKSKVILKKVIMPTDMAHDYFLIDKTIAFHEVGITGIVVNHHFINFIKTVFMGFFKTIIFHAPFPMRIAHGKAAIGCYHVDFIVIKNFINNFKAIEPIFFGTSFYTLLQFPKFIRKRLWHEYSLLACA